MNFVKLYIGDYLRDTGTLTLAQHGAYTLMLLEHYATEKPLPTGRELHRLLRADTKQERDAIDFVASKFWTLTDDGLTNGRAEREIEKASHQRTVNQELGKRGGRPKKTEIETESVIESKPIGKANRNPIQTPDTRHQKEITPHPLSGMAPPRAKPSKKCPADFAVTAEMRSWADATAPGVSVEFETAKFRDHTFATACTDWPGRWRNWMRKATEIGPKNGSKSQSETPWQKSQRERVAQFAPGLASRTPAGTVIPITIDMEAGHGTALALG
jgi:uncharacterized protein YdaU (DUF1376 family)